MPSDHPPSPQSPSQQTFDTPDFNHKLATSPNLGNNSLPTPAHSINGSMSSASDLPAFADPTSLEEISNKRKREDEDNGDRDQKKVHVEDSRISMEDLHQNVGPKYKLCNTPHSVGSIPYEQDLFQLYGLSEMAESVARKEKPDGSKGGMRKSYKGYTKTLKLGGAFESVKRVPEDPDSLLRLMAWPDEEFNRQSFGTVIKEMKSGMPLTAESQLSRALTMAKGPIPKDVWNDKVLGVDPTPRAAPIDPKMAQSGRLTPNHISSGQRPAKGELPRPKRNIKKRTYGDASFEGYGEGFIDDDPQENGYSTGGDGDGRSHKRSKKVGGLLAG